MIPIYKIFTLCLRGTTRPMVKYTKRFQINSQSRASELFRVRFIVLGNRYNQWDAWLKYKLLDIQTPNELIVYPLSDSIALDQGIQFFWEMVTYTLAIVVPLYLLHLHMNSLAEESRLLTKRFDDLEAEIKDIQSQHLSHAHKLNERLYRLEKAIQRNGKMSTQSIKEMHSVKQELIRYVEFLSSEGVKENKAKPSL